MQIPEIVKKWIAVDTPLWHLKWKAYNFFIGTPSYLLKKCVRSVQYAILGFNNHDYDFTYLLQLMRFKMDRLQQHIQEHDVHTDAKKVSRQIRDLNRILDRIIEDDYMSVETKIMLDDRPMFDEDMEEMPKGFKRWKPKKRTKKEDKLWHKEHAREESLRQRDLDRFFNDFKNQFRNWWC